MTLRQGCARVLNDHGAYNPLNLDKYAMIRQYRQGFLTYRTREKKYREFIFSHI